MVVRRDDHLSSWATISISCLSTLALLASGAAWLGPRNGWIPPMSSRRTASVMPAESPQPAVFPSWVEVPHLARGPSAGDDPEAPPSAEGPRTFLDPNPADAAEPPASLPPRANPRQPLIGRAPLDAARLTQEQPPAWTERTGFRDIARAVPPSAVATLEPDAPQPLQGRAETGTTRTRPADPTPTPILPPGPAQARPPTEVVVRPAPTVAAAPPLGRVATLGPDPAQPVVDRTIPITPPREAGGVVAPILNPGPARHARSLRRPRAAAVAAARARVPYRDAEQTASITGAPRALRARIDAGAVAYATIHRGRSAAPATAPAPSAVWTLPPALAPSD
ncbi:hypothetical protein MKK69_20855 [Methylobacterium sp. J-026]|uniref:hypothetical protein n=1 Tax=Methylobacterium sp. J-026 TaxID=2836624 RepID=UPI001FBB7BC9|nr:hypothetical protein [Methylobacterium sp. J-026]MCJ2136471.1 hypothetical protein [Methylobacterium sp. J-026]